MQVFILQIIFLIKLGIFSCLPVSSSLTWCHWIRISYFSYFKKLCLLNNTSMSSYIWNSSSKFATLKEIVLQDKQTNKNNHNIHKISKERWWPCNNNSEFSETLTFYHNWKAQSKNDPLIFRPFLKVFRSSWILACGLSFTRYTLFWFFFCWFALRFREITYAKNY